MRPSLQIKEIDHSKRATLLTNQINRALHPSRIFPGFVRASSELFPILFTVINAAVQAVANQSSL